MVDKDLIIAQLLRQNEQLTQQVQMLNAEVQLLKEKIARLEKNSSNSSKPPSSDIVNPKPPTDGKGRKRKRGGQKGHKKHKRELFSKEEIGDTIIHELDDDEIKRKKLTPLDQTELALQQVDLPRKLYTVTEHRVRLYRKPDGTVIRATLPKDIRKSGFFSPRMVSFVGYLKARGHMSYSTIQAFFGDVMNFNISTGYLVKCCLRKLSPALISSYEEALQYIRNAPIVGSDETGHRNPAYKSTWTWCQHAGDVVFFHISPSRGSRVLVELLGEEYNGILQADYYSANRKYVEDYSIIVQYCWAHLVRDLKFLAELSAKSLRNWADYLLNTIKTMLEVWRQRQQRHPIRWQRKIEKLKNKFLKKVMRPPRHSEAMNITKRFARDGRNQYFLFLEVEGVEPTNNATEHKIRHVVLDRRVTQGTRSWAGMRWCERAWTVVATCASQQRSVYEFFYDSLKAYYTNTRPPSILPQNL
jgi:hypothetical protein